MAAKQENNLVLNIVPITFNTDKIAIGRLPSLDDEQYKQLRDDHWKTHSFRYDSRTNEVLNVSLVTGNLHWGNLTK
jgi:hypothetical protein